MVGDDVTDLVQNDVILVRTGGLPLVEDDIHGRRHEPEPERPWHLDRMGHQADRPAALPGQPLAQLPDVQGRPHVQLSQQRPAPLPQPAIAHAETRPVSPMKSSKDIEQP
jgi:hypothetical protein